MGAYEDYTITPSDRDHDRGSGLMLETPLQGQRVLLVGGGAEALRHAGMLRDEGALVHWHRPAGAASAPAPGVVSLDSPLSRELVRGYDLLVAAGATALTNRIALGIAARCAIPAACTGQPEAGSVRLRTVARHGSVRISVSAAHECVAEDVRARLAGAVPDGYAELTDWVARHASRVRTTLGDGEAYRRFWRDLLDSGLAETILNGHIRAADEQLDEALSRGPARRGEVYLIGAGPGDPDLLTLRALRLLRQADVVLYDRLVAADVLALARADARLVNVGKARDRHTLPQAQINRHLREYARAGLRVARLKGGDPFIFGRGGEEIDTLMEAGVPFQVVPGITAASGCAAYAGIPLTHRDHAQSCLFVTGHRRANGSLDLDFTALASGGQTVVFYMGLATIDDLAAGLLAHGAPADRPAAIVEQGATRQQRVVITTIRGLPERAARAGVGAPALIIIGDVVRLRDRLAWFGAAGDEGTNEKTPAVEAGVV